jgi:Mycolic acid cyclopropane synthetase
MAPLHNRSGSRSPVFERGTLWDLLELLRRNQLEQRSGPGNSVIGPLQAFLSRMRRGDSRRAAMRHVAHHYDLPHEHYRRFLDADLQYSCAYFADPSFSLEQAREAKKRHIAANPSLICSANSGPGRASPPPARASCCGDVMTSEDRLLLILRRLDEIEHALDHVLEELRTPTAIGYSARRGNRPRND